MPTLRACIKTTEQIERSLRVGTGNKNVLSETLFKL